MKDLNELVKRILAEHKEAGDDDFKVIGYVIKALKPEAMQLTFGQALWNHSKLDLPSFESIRRTRQKIQHDHLSSVESFTSREWKSRRSSLRSFRR